MCIKEKHPLSTVKIEPIFCHILETVQADQRYGKFVLFTHRKLHMAF